MKPTPLKSGILKLSKAKKTPPKTKQKTNHQKKKGKKSGAGYTAQQYRTAKLLTAISKSLRISSLSIVTISELKI